MKALTPRQSQYLHYLREYQAEHGYYPTSVEIARHFGIACTTARQTIQLLCRKGFLFRVGTRAFRLNDPESLTPATNLKTWDALISDGGVIVRLPTRSLTVKECKELALELEILAEEIEEAANDRVGTA